MILIVNGGEELQTAFESALNDRHLQHAPSIEAAGRCLTDADPDLVVANEQMPDGSVHDLRRAIHTPDRAADSPALVAFTDDSFTGDVTDGALDGYLRKPVTSSRVEAVLSQLDLVSEYEAAVEHLFHLSQWQACDERDGHSGRSTELATARRKADERLADLQRECEASVFEVLFDASDRPEVKF